MLVKKCFYYCTKCI